MDDISSKSCSTICRGLSLCFRTFAPFCHCIGHILIKFLWLVFALVDCWSIASSPRLVEWWLAVFLQKEHFLLDSLFSLNFPKIIETVYQARGFLGAHTAGWFWPVELISKQKLLATYSNDAKCDSQSSLQHSAPCKAFGAFFSTVSAEAGTLEKIDSCFDYYQTIHS